MECAIFTYNKNTDIFRYLAYNGENYVWADKDGYIRAVHAGHNRKETRFMFISEDEAAETLAKCKNEHTARYCIVGAAPYVSMFSMFYESINGTIYTGTKLHSIYCDIMQKDPRRTTLVEAEDYFVEGIGTMKVVSAEKAFAWLFKHGDLHDMVVAVMTMKECGLKEAYEYVKTERQKSNDRRKCL